MLTPSNVEIKGGQIDELEMNRNQIIKSSLSLYDDNQFNDNSNNHYGQHDNNNYIYNNNNSNNNTINDSNLKEIIDIDNDNEDVDMFNDNDVNPLPEVIEISDKFKSTESKQL